MNLPAARELGDLGIRANSIARSVRHAADQESGQKQDLIEMVRRPPNAWVNRRQEFAEACAFPMESAYMNGRVLRFDAATILQAKVGVVTAKLG